jgi:hypothetical protein
MNGIVSWRTCWSLVIVAVLLMAPRAASCEAQSRKQTAKELYDHARRLQDEGRH